MDFKIVGVVEEQIAVSFTGRINILSTFNQQFLGNFLFKNGEIFQVNFKGHHGLKAFYQLIIQEYGLEAFDYVVEPEVVSDAERQIHYPYSIVKNKMNNILKLYKDSIKQKPPAHLKILINGLFMQDNTEITPEEFDVLSVLTEWSKVEDVYQHCHLLDHEITGALVGLRKKNALKILASKEVQQ